MYVNPLFTSGALLTLAGLNPLWFPQDQTFNFERIHGLSFSVPLRLYYLSFFASLNLIFLSGNFISSVNILGEPLDSDLVRF